MSIPPLVRRAVACFNSTHYPGKLNATHVHDPKWLPGWHSSSKTNCSYHVLTIILFWILTPYTQNACFGLFSECFMEFCTHVSTVVPRPFLANWKWPGYEARHTYTIMVNVINNDPFFQSKKNHVSCV